MRQETVLALVDLVYGAALDAAQWPRFLDSLSCAIGGCGAGLAFASEGIARLHTGVGIFGSEFQKEYQAFAPCDPWLLRSRGGRLWQAGTIGIGEDLVPMRELERTDFYNDFGRRHDYIGGLSSIVVANKTGLAAVSVCVRRGRAFGQPEVDLMRMLMPHLRRALQVHTRLAASDAHEHGLRHALDRLATGAILVAKAGTVLFVNDSARETLSQRDGLTIDRGELRAQRASDTATLRTLIGGAGGTAAGNGLQSGGVLVLDRPSGRRPIQVVVSPLVAADVLEEPQAHVIVFITDPERSPEPDLDLLRRVHSLSRAEAEVARLLLQDKTPHEIGDLLGISVNTVRFHLKQLFSKTGTRRQSELVRILLTTAQLRHT